MHRSASTTRVSDEYYLAVAPTKTPSSASRSSPLHRSASDLPSYNPLSDAGKKEALRSKFAENMVHAIPLVLILCAAVLWFFSYTEIMVSDKDRSFDARIKNTSMDG